MTKSDIESGPDDRGDNGSSLRDLSESIEAMVEKLEPPLSSNCCIYRVPKKLRELNEAAYTPHLVSIGPFHIENKELQTMKKHKVRYMKKILQRPGVLEDLVSYIKGCEDKVRSYYAEAIELKGNDFLMMVLLDGCFIIEHFRIKDLEEDEYDKILQQSLFREDTTVDLFLLENQLPFFLLEGLYNIAFPTTSNPPPVSFYDLSCEFFWRFQQKKSKKKAEEVKHCTDLLRTFILPTPTKEKVEEVPPTPAEEKVGEVKHFTDLLRTFILPSPTKEKVEEVPEKVGKVKHFTDLLRTFILPSPTKEKVEEVKPNPAEEVQYLKSATELQEAGVQFKKNESSECLFEIQFSGGKLKIPVLKFDDVTESYFRNIMALEQSHPYSEIASLSSYIFLMDKLIDTSKDVDLLVRAKIIENWLGDNNQVVTLVNSLCKEILVPPGTYRNICEALNKYCEKRWNRWMATCRRDYLSTPWRIASTIAAFVLLFLTFIQAVASIISLSI